MKRTITLILAALMVASLFAGCKKEETVDTTQLASVKFDAFAVGYGKAEITPDPASQIMMVGNNDHASRLSTSVLEPLWATCIAFTDTEGETVLLFGADLHGAEKNSVKKLRAAIEEATGVPGDHVQFNASHTHSGPSQGESAIGSVRRSDEYILSQCLQAAIDALQSRKPAKMYTTFCRPENMNFLRHYIKTDGTYVGEGAGEIPSEQLLGHMEKADNLMQLVKFTREGEKDVIMINWQAHPTQWAKNSEYYTAISSENVGIMRRVLLEQAGVESIYILGGEGDVVSRSVINEEKIYNNDVASGTALAEAAIAAFADFKEAETGNIEYKTEMVRVGDFDFELGAFGFGDFGFASQPWEAFQTLAMAVKEQSPYTMTFFGAICNNSYGYLPDDFSYNYQIYETVATFVPRGSGEMVRDKLLSMLGECFTASGQTQKEKPEGYIMDHSPKSNGKTYTVIPEMPPVEGQNGHYQVKLANEGTLKTVLVWDKALADEIMALDTVKLLFDERNIAVEIDK